MKKVYKDIIKGWIIIFIGIFLMDIVFYYFKMDNIKLIFYVVVFSQFILIMGALKVTLDMIYEQRHLEAQDEIF